MGRSVMWIDWRIVSEAANVTVIRRIGAQNVVYLLFRKIMIARVQRIGGSEQVSVHERNECGVRRVAQGPEAVDEHQSSGGPRAGADRPVIQPSLSVRLELVFAGQFRHEHVGAEVLVIPTLGPGEAWGLGSVLLAHCRVELARSVPESRIAGGQKK